MVAFLNEIVAALELEPGSGATSGTFEAVEADDIPEPSKSLLVHRRDMTGTLADFWGGRIHIEPLQVRREGDDVYREVVLVAGDNGAGRRVEAGAIRIRLGAFPEQARREILGNRTPLGAILTAHEIPYVSSPRAYFRTRTNEFLRGSFPGDPEGMHYGRHNVLTAPDGATLAEVIEILPVL